MALSNWDTCSWNEKGEPINGIFITPRGIGVHVYKNWLYVSDEKAWHEDVGYIKPTIMQIDEGRLSYGDLNIEAIRGPQNGVYAACWSGRLKDFTGMIGIGVYGFDGRNWVGVTAQSINWIQTEAFGHKPEVGRMVDQHGNQVGAEWTTDPETEEIPVVLLRRMPKEVLRFNQGDAFFANAGGFDVPSTEPEKSEAPLLIQALKKENE